MLQVPAPCGPAKLADVAALAGVSVGTASKALNGGGRMRPETRQRVLDAVDALGFRPNQHAQSLHTGRSWTVGLMTTDGIGRFSTPVLLGAEDALGAARSPSCCATPAATRSGNSTTCAT